MTMLEERAEDLYTRLERTFPQGHDKIKILNEIKKVLDSQNTEYVDKLKMLDWKLPPISFRQYITTLLTAILFPRMLFGIIGKVYVKHAADTMSKEFVD